MKVHLIAIGGAIMHNLAIALKRQGHQVSGSDDAIYDPARANLQKAGLLPEIGWNPESITTELDCLILGMHARPDNPELLEAQKKQLKILSFPEFIAQHAEGKKRVVIAGSHGKTSTTSMIMHVLRKLQFEFDYLVGAKIQDFDLSVQLSDAPLILIEGDEYLSSPIDRRSKFLWYKPDLVVITGIAWDHINVFPTFASYLQTFQLFLEGLSTDAKVFWFESDTHLQKLLKQKYAWSNKAYGTPKHRIEAGGITVDQAPNAVLSIFGEHNLQNANAARLVCEQLGISGQEFYAALADFKGAGRRLELLKDKDGVKVFRDFAHAPSKLEATLKAVKQYQTKNQLTAVFELHTFSSLNKKFIGHYKNSMDLADSAIVFYDAHIFKHRKMEVIHPEEVKEAFGTVRVVTDKQELKKCVEEDFQKGNTVLLMSSGNFNKTLFQF